MEDPKQSLEDSGSLETADAVEQQTGAAAPVSAPTPAPPEVETPLASPKDTKIEGPTPKKPSVLQRFRRLADKFNIYSLLLAFILILVGGTTYFAIQNNRKSAEDSALNTKTLTVEDLANLSNADAKVGDPKQTLSIESNAIFAGKVLVRDSVDVAGALRVGGTLSLNGINVAGGSTLEALQTSSLAVSGDASIQGKVNIQNNLTVNGSGTFSGPLSATQLTIDTLQLNRDLVINRHIEAGGSTPTRTNGSALGSGGTSTVTGSDTSGSVTINTGGGAPAGCFITVNFAAAFANVPNVVITPIGSAGAALNYYVNRTASGFSVCTASDPPDGTAGIVFDYIVIG